MAAQAAQGSASAPPQETTQESSAAALGLDDASLARAWDGALALIAERGEDPATVVAEAAAGLARIETRPLSLGSPPDALAHDARGAQLVDAYLATLGSPKSRATVEESLRRILYAIGGVRPKAPGVAQPDVRAMPWHLLDFAAIQRIRTALAERHKPAAANLSLSALRRLLTIGRAMGLTTDAQVAALQVAAANVRGSRLTKGRALERSEFQRLLDHVEDRFASEASDGDLALHAAARRLQLRALLFVFVGAGLRREEVCTLRLPDVRDGSLRVVGKGNKERRLPLAPREWDELSAWLAVRRELPAGHDRVFVIPPGARGALEPMKPRFCWWTVVGLSDGAGLSPRITPHDFRRTFASRLLDYGLDLLEVQRLMGHSKAETTGRYDKRASAALDAKRRAIAIFD